MKEDWIVRDVVQVRLPPVVVYINSELVESAHKHTYVVNFETRILHRCIEEMCKLCDCQCASPFGYLRTDRFGGVCPASVYQVPEDGAPDVIPMHCHLNLDPK